MKNKIPKLQSWKKEEFPFHLIKTIQLGLVGKRKKPFRETASESGVMFDLSDESHTAKSFSWTLGVAVHWICSINNKQTECLMNLMQF